MHILLIHQFFLEDHDGGGARWNEMGRMWREQGHEVTVLAGTVHYMGHPLPQYRHKWCHEDVNKDGIKVIRCFVPASYNRNYLHRFFAYVSFLISSLYGGIFHAKDRYDLILVSSPPLLAGASGLLLSRIKRVPLLVEVRDLWPDSAIDAGVIRNKYLIVASLWLEKKLYEGATAITVLTPAFAEVLTKHKKVPAEKIILATNAADFGLAERAGNMLDIAKFRKKEGLDKFFTIVYVGAHGLVNDLQTVLKAAEILQNDQAFFLFVGDGMQRDALIQEALKKGLKNVRFTGFVDKQTAFQYIMASDAGLSILKKADTFKTVYSNKTFDYFSCRKPVLMAIEGASRELVEQANAGLFVEPENADDLAEKIRTYLADPELVSRHGENGYLYAKANFKREKLAQKYLDEIGERISILRESST